MKKNIYKKFTKNEKINFIKDKKNELKGMIKDFFLNEEDLKKLSKRYILLSDEKFYQYSLRNTILIIKQNGSICLSFVKWKKKERFVKKDSRAIKIFVPYSSKHYICKCCKKSFFYKDDAIKHDKNIKSNFTIKERVKFNIGNVFDINDTDGKDLNFKYAANIKSNPNLDFYHIKDILSKEFNFTVNNVITKSRGHVSHSDHNSIFLSSCSNNSDKTKTLIHELAHLILHVRSGKINILKKEVKEVEAEAVAYIIASFLDIELTFSELYIKSFSNSDIINNVDFNSICALAENILNILNSSFQNISKIA